ncbi:hypothetical protein MPH_04182, partial [Macrophomina phaseolina MS6]
IINTKELAYTFLKIILGNYRLLKELILDKN